MSYLFIGFVFSLIIFSTALIENGLNSVDEKFVILIAILNAWLFWLIYVVFFYFRLRQNKKILNAYKNLEELI